MDFQDYTRVVVIGILVFSGCAGAGGGLEIVAQDADTTTFGNIEITVTVENTADEPREGTIECEVRTGGQVYDDATRVAVGSNQRETVKMAFDIPVSDFGEGGEYGCRLS